MELLLRWRLAHSWLLFGLGPCRWDQSAVGPCAGSMELREREWRGISAAAMDGCPQSDQDPRGPFLSQVHHSGSLVFDEPAVRITLSHIVNKGHTAKLISSYWLLGVAETVYEV